MHDDVLRGGLLFAFGRPQFGPPLIAGSFLVIIHSRDGDLIRTRYELDRDRFVIGCDMTAHGVLRDGLVHDRHLCFTIEMVDGQPRWVVGDQSTDDAGGGLAVNDVWGVDQHPLKSGDRIEIGRTVLLFFETEADYRDVSHWITVMDGQLSMFNRTYFDLALEREIRKMRGRGRRLSVITFRVDRLQELRQRHDDRTMTKLLREVALRVEEHVTVDWVFARYTAEVFAVILSETNASYARARGMAMRAMVGRVPFQLGDATINATVSIGVAQLEPDDEGEDVVHRAVRAMDAASDAGGDRIVYHKE